MSAVKAFTVRNPLTVIGGIVTLVALVVTMVCIFSFSGQELDSGQKMLVITTIIGLVANAIPSLLGLLKSEATQHDLRNGVVKNKVKEAIVEVAADTDSQGVYLDTHGIDTGKDESSG